MEDALENEYSHLWWIVFLPEERNKDVLCYLRLVINPRMKRSLDASNQLSARGIGNTTIEKLLVAANHYKRSIFEVMQNIDKIDLKLNAGTKQKLLDFVTMILFR
jgi:DNA helicase-2/ATP-dependent DNA helicase PcrA